ncbi:unnamed protein product [Rotaria sordida]|uniref:Phytanoyl-CoA dioxygenase n=1 Tax=Rotaria sordida TaxID=392033 RepID=A0A819IFU3_9BILA|nr:unnamed protein product [Rotaria sordida]CAF1120267.1 unnamed protein product [Rotaria sordida]CAF1120284.1 unnamed protein product [Rotaria sordida]CAF1135412.1 unnamed protein product [Rotaria sordida]CAF1201530.1 unnamed protein product [Rotaria sordida]
MATSYSSDKNSIRIDHTTLTPRYSITNEESLNEGINYLNEHGYAVFSDVLSQDEININKDLLWKFFETIPGCNIRRDDPSTWSTYWPGFPSHGVVNNCGIGQSDFMWNIRSNRNIKRVYSQIWNTNELLVSFDGCGVFRDWRYDSKWKTKSGWYHVDQNPVLKPNRCCIQGFVSLTDQNEKTGGLIVVPYSHLRFAQLTQLGHRLKDFIMIPRDHPILDRGRAIGKFIQCQAGDLVLWDSRLIHCNSPAFSIEERHENEPIDLLRIVAYVCMIPTAFVQGYTIDKFRKERKLLVENNCTLTHWSTELVQTRSSGDLPKISLKKFDAYQRALILGTDFDGE